MVMIDTPEEIAYFVILQLRARMNIETHSDMKFKGQTTMSIINQRFGKSFRRKKDALEYINWVAAEAKLALDAAANGVVD